MISKPLATVLSPKPRWRGAAGLLALCAALALSGCNKLSAQDLTASGQDYLKNGDAKSAIVQLKAALQQNPQLPQARFLLGSAMLKTGDASAAVLELEKAHDLKYSQDELLPLLAKATMAAGQAKKVTDLYSRVDLADPVAHADLKATVAAAFGAQGLIERSNDYVKLALQLDPKNGVARLLKARLAAGRGEFNAALAAVEAVIADKADLRAAWHLKGEILLIGKGDKAGAAAAMEKTLELEPRFLPAHSALISMALEQRDTPGFKRRVEALRIALPKHPETRFYDAQTALLDNNPKAARDITQQLLRVAPDNFRVLQLAGAVELAADSLVLAETHLNKALQLEPRLSVARRLLAQTYLRGGQPARALAALQPLLDGPAPTVDVLGSAAEAYMRNNQFAEAEAAFARAAKLTPNDPKIETALALAHIANGNVTGGYAELEALATRDTNTYPDLALISSLMKRNDNTGALKAVDRLQTKQPSSALPHLLRGRILALNKDRAGARSAFEKGLAAEPRNYSAVAGLAALDVEEKKFDNASKRLEDHLASNPKNYRALMALAQLRQQTGAPAQSIRKLLADAVTANPAEAAPRLLLVEYLLSQNDASAARAAAQEAVAALPADPQLLDALGRAQLATGDVQQAISAFGKLASDQPASVLAQLRLADAHLQNKDRAAAGAALRKALQISPKSLPAQRGLVQLALADKRHGDALDMARIVQRQRPSAAVGYLLETDVHASQRQWPPALAALRNALERDKATLTAMRLYSMLTVAGQAAEAEKFAGNWRRDHPKDAGFLFHLGASAMDGKRYPQAELHYQQVLSLRPQDATALNNLAWVMLQQGKPGALAHAEKAVQMAPEQAAFLDTLAAVLAAQGQLPQALEWQRKAVDKAGERGKPAYRLTLAKLLRKAGDAPAARAELEALRALGDKFSGQAEVTQLLAAP